MNRVKMPPAKGKSFIVYKKGRRSYSGTGYRSYVLIKMRVPASARRVLPKPRDNYDQKMRVSEVKVISITSIKKNGKEGRAKLKAAVNYHSNMRGVTRYVVGEVVVPSYFDPSKTSICTGGIHCFMDKATALRYC